MSKIKRKSADNYPLDRTGEMLYNGSIVLFAEPITVPPAVEDIPPLLLGYILKLGKSFADVRYWLDENACTIRVREPQRRLVIVDPDHLDSRVAEYERVKYEAAMAK